MSAKPFSYASTVVPEGYVCADCGATAVRLYRGYQSFGENVKLRCLACSRAHQKGAPNNLFSQADSTIGWCVPAIPKEDGEDYWGFTQVPNEGSAWWNGLPK